MAIPQKIKNLANKVRTAVYGKEVRESLAESMEETANVADETKTRQDSLETQFQDVLDETTGKDIISAPEILAARGSHANLKQRLDSEYQEVTTQLAQIAINVDKYRLPDDVDDTQAFIRAFTEIQQNNGGSIILSPNKTYNIVCPINDTLFTFSNIQYFNLISNGAIIKDNQQYSMESEEVSTFIEFSRSKNINVDLSIISQRLNVSRTGLNVLLFKDGCERISLELYIDSARSGVRFHREVGDGTKKCQNIRGNVTAKYVRYPWVGGFSGDNANIVLSVEYCGRNYFVYGVNNNDVKIQSKNQQVTTLIKSYHGLGCENIKVDYYDKESTGSFPSRELVAVEFGDNVPAKMINIDIQFNVENKGGWGNTFGIFKYLDGSPTQDNIGRGHVIDGLKLSGKMVNATGYVHAWSGLGEFNQPDIIRNLSISDLILDGGVAFNLRFGNVGGEFYANNVISDGPFYLQSTEGRTIFTQCTATNFTASPTSDVKHKYIDCVITAGTLQNYNDNKVFVNTVTPNGLRDSTGILQERTENNYHYVRLGDGTVICTIKTTINATSTGIQTVQLPFGVVETPTISVSLDNIISQTAVSDLSKLSAGATQSVINLRMAEQGSNAELPISILLVARGNKTIPV